MRVSTTCLRLLRSSARAGVEPATSQSLVRRSTRSEKLIKRNQFITIIRHFVMLLFHLNAPGHLFPANGIVFVEMAENVELDEQRVFDEGIRLQRQ